MIRLVLCCSCCWRRRPWPRRRPRRCCRTRRWRRGRAGARQGAALPRLPEPVDRRFRRRPRPRPAPAGARPPDRRRQRRAGAGLRDRPLRRLRAAQAAGEAGDLAVVVRAGRRAPGRRRPAGRLFPRPRPATRRRAVELDAAERERLRRLLADDASGPRHERPAPRLRRADRRSPCWPCCGRCSGASGRCRATASSSRSIATSWPRWSATASAA